MSAPSVVLTAKLFNTAGVPVLQVTQALTPGDPCAWAIAFPSQRDFLGRAEILVHECPTSVPGLQCWLPDGHYPAMSHENADSRWTDRFRVGESP